MTTGNTNAHGIRTLFSIPPERFLSEYWTKQPRFEQHDPARLSGLIDIPELRSVETMVRAPHRNIRIDVRTLEGAPANTHPSAEDAVKLYLAGNTLFMSSLLPPAFVPFVEQLTRELHVPPGLIRINAFASRRSHGVVPHFDCQDNIAIQVRGTKIWRLAPNHTIRNPVWNGHVDKPGASPKLAPNFIDRGMRARLGITDWPTEMPVEHETFEMKPGSVLYIPRGWWHTVETIDESLHIIPIVRLPTPVDVAMVMMSMFVDGFLSADETWRAPIVDGWDENGPRADVVAGVLQRIGPKFAEFATSGAKLTKENVESALAAIARQNADY